MSQKNIKQTRLELINKRSREPIEPPRLFGHIQKQAIKCCEQLLAHLFSASDDLFYDLSKRASSNTEQNLYFEAMREVRIKREGIANNFLRAMSGRFSKIIDLHETPFDTDFGEDNDFDSNLSIVEGDVLEVDLARSNMVSRARDMFKEELYDLTSRLDHLLLQVRIDEENNPLDPKQLADIFIEACQEKLDVNIKAKLILYKLFEKHVLKQLGHLYADANKILLEAGILPKVPKDMDGDRIVHGGGDREHHESSDETSQHAQPSGYQTPTAADPRHVEFRMGYDALSMLMAAARNLAFNQTGSINTQAPSGRRASDIAPNGIPRGVVAGGVPVYFYSANPGPVMPSPELTQLLTQSQPVFDERLASGQPQNIVADVVQQLLAKKDPEKPQALEQSEENIINLVAMFFDQISADESLPIAVQSLIFRMQIPILKVALKDQSFFNNPMHPARQLINGITKASTGFDESKPIERDPLYKKMVNIVHTLNRQYKTDDSIFSELLDELQKALEREQRKSSIVEERTTQTEAGKSRIRQARSATQAVIYEKLKDVEMPEVVKSFLTTHWLQVMVITFLKNGSDSSEWVSNEQTISDLIWITKQHDDPRSKQRRDRLLPELMDRIEMGLEAAIDNPDLRSTKVTALEDSLKALYEEEAPEATFTPLSEEQKEALGKGEDAPKSWQEMTAVERQKARYEELSSLYFEQAKDMPPGTWFDYFDEDSGKQLRCKLTSKIDADTFIFVNRLGLKSLEKSRKQFAYDLQFKRAKLVDTSPLFDRIMRRVVSNISDEK